MQEDAPKTIRLEDYRPPDYPLDAVELHFELGETLTTVRSRLSVRRSPTTDGERPLVLDGQDLELDRVRIDGTDLPETRYTRAAESLTIDDIPPSCILEFQTRISPQDNTSLEGLYRSGHMLCTQCEAEGFRKITYFFDRPDVMTRYTTTLVADRERYPLGGAGGQVLNYQPNAG